MKEFFEIDGNAADPGKEGRDYAAKLRSADPQLCLLGIGENGHLAFNGPAVANFGDPVDAKCTWTPYAVSSKRQRVGS
jgi:glucosamine-6-phosphate deaminase